MTDVIAVEFGKEQRESARKLGRLLGLLEERNAEMLRDPKKYFDMAADEIVRLRAFQRRLWEATCGEPASPRYKAVDCVAFETCIVTKQDYEMLRALKAIANEAWEAQFPPTNPDPA